VDTCEDIAGDIFVRGGHRASSRSAHAPIVHAKYRDTAPCQVIGQNEKRFMTGDVFVPALRSRSGNQDNVTKRCSIKFRLKEANGSGADKSGSEL
jgi:hypothetical protein